MAFLQNDPSKAIDSLGSFPERCSSTAPDHLQLQGKADSAEAPGHTLFLVFYLEKESGANGAWISLRS